MPVLKTESSRRVLKDAIVLDMADLDRHAKRILEEAQTEAARVLADAQRQAERLRADAAGIGHAQGLEQGLAEGREKGRDEGRRHVIGELGPRLELVLDAWSSTLKEWDRSRGEMLASARQDVLALAIEIGRKIVLRSIEADPEIVVNQVAETLSYLTKPTQVTVSIHPDDRALVEKALPALLEQFSKCEHAAIREEPAMQRGGCLLSTGSGRIDATIETQVDRIVEALLPRVDEAKKE